MTPESLVQFGQMLWSWVFAVSYISLPLMAAFWVIALIIALLWFGVNVAKRLVGGKQ